MTKIIYKCRHCGSEDVSGQISSMVPLNKPLPANFPVGMFEWDDYNYCNECQDDCKVMAVETEDQA